MVRARVVLQILQWHWFISNAFGPSVLIRIQAQPSS